MQTWQPISIPELEELVTSQLLGCTPAQQAAFATYRVPFYPVSFQRPTALKLVLVVANLPSGLLYYEDVEEGFEVGAMDADGVIQDHGCNQLELTQALAREGF